MFGFVVRLIFGLGIALILMWSGGLLWFATTLPRDVADSRSRTDGIVVLTGGSARINTGIALMAGGRSKKMLISGVHRKTTQGALSNLLKSSPTLFECCIELGRAARDTLGNALEASAWTKRENLKSLRLVTSAYHMPRSLVEFRRLMPGVRLIAHPVFSDTVKLAGWWRWPGTAALLGGEFNKYLFSLARARFGEKAPA